MRACVHVHVHAHIRLIVCYISVDSSILCGEIRGS